MAFVILNLHACDCEVDPSRIKKLIRDFFDSIAYQVNIDRFSENADPAVDRFCPARQRGKDGFKKKNESHEREDVEAR